VLSIAVDAMSGDLGPRANVAGALEALGRDPQLRILLVGDPASIDAARRDTAGHGGADALHARIEVVPASDVVTMGESPRTAIRRRKHSSMRVAVDLVKDARAGACVSAGNTGALTAMAHFVLKTVPGVERAAIMSAIPSRLGHTHMLDLGANTRATAQHLQQFALMGSIVARDVYGLARPRVGLLNIGEEEIKGHDIVREAHELIGQSALNDVGFVEGNDIFTGEVDVVVTDGFTGNVALKTMEGVADLIASRLRAEFARTVASRLAGLLARSVLRRVGAGLDPRRYNGACMVGLAGVVVKSHGRADPMAFAQAIAIAAAAARQGLPQHVARALGSEQGG
jgi:phosphate acyltransferase